MSLTQSIANAMSGLTAASRMAEVVSSNLANAMTDGYAKREVELTPETIGGVGAGVRVTGITRQVDRGILADRRLADSAVAGYTATTDMLSRLEALGAVDSDASLSNRIAALEESLIAAGSDPSSSVRLDNVLTRLQEVAGSLNDQSDGIQKLRQEADTNIAEQVDALNLALNQVAQLNADITSAKANGLDAAALMDARQTAVDKIAAIVPIREVDRASNQIGLVTTSGLVLLDGSAKDIGFTPTHTITADMTLDSGALSSLTIDGKPVDSTAAGRLDGGSLGAAFALRDKTLPDAQKALDAIAADLIDRFDDGTSPGLFTDAGAALDLSDTDGLAARIAVNTVVDPDQGGATWRLRDGLTATSESTAASATQFDTWLDALAEQRALPTGGAARAASGHAGAYLASLGNTRLAAEGQLSFATARWDTLKEAELANGVDSDQELQSLMQIEQTYAANARLISVLDDMMQTLLEL